MKPPLLILGPNPPHQTRGIAWIALNSAATRIQSAGEMLVGRECNSLSELEEDIAQIRGDLTEILRLARLRFASGNS